jgi:hypothetical protein
MKQQFLLKLIPPRPTFMLDMTPDEKVIMQQHVLYWTNLLNDGIAIVFGPILGPGGGYGVGVVTVESEEQLKTLIACDPANGLNKYEFFPMRAVFKQND